MAYDIGPRIGIEGEKAFRQAIYDINGQLRTLDSEMKKVASSFDGNEKSVKTLTTKNEILNKQIDSQTDKINELRKGLELANDKYGESDKVTQGWQRALNLAETDLNNLNKSLKSNTEELKNYGKAQIQAVKDSKEFSEAQEKLGKTLDIVKTAALASATAVAGSLVASAKSAIDYESAFAGVRKTVNATEEELAGLSKGIRDMSKDIPAAATDIAGVAEAAGQLGIETDNILEFTRTMIDLGEATNLSSDEAASALAQFQNVTQMSQKDFDKLGSVIVELGNNMATTEADIVNMAQRLAGAGTQVGLTESEIMSFAAALSSVGIEAEAGGSAFSKVFVNMQLAVETGSESLDEFANVAGLSASEFKKAFQEDAAGAMISFIQGLSTAEDRGVSAIKVLDDMGISEVRMRDSLLRAAGASDLFSKSIDIGTKAWEENNALSKEAEQRYATTESQIKIIKNTITDLAIQIGEKLLPKITEWTTKLKELDTQPIVDGFTWIIDNAGTIAAGAAAIAAGMVAWNVVGIVQSLLAVMKVWKVATQGMTIAQKLLNLAMAANPIGIIIAVIAALVAGIIVLWNTNDEFRESVIAAWEKIKETGASVWEWLVKFFTEDIPNAIKATIEWFETLPKKAQEYFSALGERIKENLRVAIDNIKKWGKETIAWVVTEVPKIISNIVGFFSSLPGKLTEQLAKALVAIANWIINGVLKVKAEIPKIISAIKDAFLGLPGDMLDIGSNIVSGLWNGISNSISWLKQKVSGFASGIVSGIKDKLQINSPSKVTEDEVGKPVVQGIVRGIVNNMKTARAAMRELSENIVVNGNSAGAIQSNSTMRYEHGGTIKVKGVNDQNQTVGVTQIVMDDLRRDSRR